MWTQLRAEIFISQLCLLLLSLFTEIAQIW